MADVANIAQVTTALIAVVALIVTIGLARATTRELRIDRRLRMHPVVMFTQEGIAFRPIRRVFGHRIAGMNPPAVERDFVSIPDDSKVNDVEHFYGELVNVGSGPACGILVTFMPEEVEMGDHAFDRSDDLLTDPRYGAEYNALPAMPELLTPGAKAELTRLPTFIVLDSDRKITNVNGVAKIEYRDVFGNDVVTKQRFVIFAEMSDGHYTYMFRGDEIEGYPTIVN